MKQKFLFRLMAQVPPYEAVIMPTDILFWRRAFLIRDISVFSKYRFAGYHLGLLGEFNKGFNICYDVLQAMEMTKMVAK